MCRQGLCGGADDARWVRLHCQDSLGHMAEQLHHRKDGHHHQVLVWQVGNKPQGRECPRGCTSGHSASSKWSMQHTKRVLQTTRWILLWCGAGHSWFWFLPLHMRAAHLNYREYSYHHLIFIDTVFKKRDCCKGMGCPWLHPYAPRISALTCIMDLCAGLQSSIPFRLVMLWQ